MHLFVIPHPGNYQNGHINIFNVFSGVNTLEITGKTSDFNEIVHNIDIGKLLFSVCADSPIRQPFIVTSLENNIKLAIFFK